VPAQQRVRRDDEPRADRAGHHPAETGEDATIGVSQLGPARRPGQHRDLMTQRHHLYFEHPTRLAANHQQADDRDEQAIRERADPGANLGRRGR